MVDVIAPADAFRLLLSARYGKADLKFPRKIKSDAWFWGPSWLGVPTSVHRRADKAIKKLRKHVRDGDIRLRGELKPAEPPDYIDRADCLVGRLDVFAQTLTIYAHGFKPARIYRRVFCVKDDVMKILEGISKNRSGFRSKPVVKKAPPSLIRTEIGLIYDNADKNKNAPRPNLAQLPGVVKPRLEARGFEASGKQIKKIGSEPLFDGRRNKRGKRLT